MNARKEIPRRLSQIVIDIVVVVYAAATDAQHRTPVIFDGFPCITSSNVVSEVTLLLEERKDSFLDSRILLLSPWILLFARVLSTYWY